ncbi:DUF1003 domain-containing protein [Dyadobacter arcticus]|uniref:Membrane protein n=1 Tax=Dyadobacter arcticus TaxID=1078754 RepID=A0ABX0UHL3_9BACT|nr:DUF1003 domain-containing protein [Dyadobacter arcticus]NIJ52517.1 putative membrane protein [Dyadobacter arcticus]
MDDNTQELLISGDRQIAKLKQIVQQAIDEEKLIAENLLHQPTEILTRGQTISDKVASFGGSWKFIITFSVILTLWILFNTLSPREVEFDPYPFILMNLVLSAIAALQAPIIMMSQNRKEEKDRKRSENDYLVNLKAELEVRSLHQKIDLLLEEQIKVLFDSQAKQLDILRSIETKLDNHQKN